MQVLGYSGNRVQGVSGILLDEQSARESSQNSHTYALLKTKLQLVPPKPKLLDITF